LMVEPGGGEPGGVCVSLITVCTALVVRLGTLPGAGLEEVQRGFST
jgi:hypothetical protein